MKEHGIVSRITEGCFRYQGWPTVTRAEDGTLYAASSGHRLGHVCPFGKNLMYVSTDQGKSWSAPQIINDTWLDDRDAGLLAWGDGTLLLSWFNHPTKMFRERESLNKPHYILTSDLAMGMRNTWEQIDPALLQAGSFTRISYDNGKTWSKPRKLPVTAPHGPIRKKNGALLYVGRAFQWDGLEEGIYVYESHDDGESWELLSQIHAPAGTPGLSCEPHAIELEDGSILAGVRIQHPDFPGKLKTFTALSPDGGKSWEESVLLDLLGAPPHFMRHSSGAIVMSYGRRYEPMGQYVRISRDNGKTWGRDVLISPESPSWDQGYPSTVELDDATLLTVYYQRYGSDEYASVLSTHWSLDEAE